MKIRESIEFDAVRWSKILDLLVTRLEIGFQEADAMMRDFFRRFRKPFNLYWFLHERLSPSDNALIAALCSYQGADIIELHRKRGFRLGPAAFDYTLLIELEPDLRALRGEERAGRCSARIEVELFGMKTAIDDVRRLVLFQVFLALLALFAYVIGMGLLLYGFSVLFLFLHMPLETAAAATTQAPIGLALMCVLVGLAGLFGRAVSNLVKLAIERLRKPKG